MLTGEGVHVVTANDIYLQKCWVDDANMIFLGISVGINLRVISKEKQDVYNCDLTYSTNNEIGLII